MMAPLSEEEDNYIRLALLLKGVSPRAVRTFFDKEFPPIHLPSTLNKKYNTLLDLKKTRVLNQKQWEILFPRNTVVDSSTFDVTLMICLIRNLTSVTPPIKGYDKLPEPGEETPGPDLARIKWYRNELAHHDRTTMSTTDFNKAWIDIVGAIRRFGGMSMDQECQDLRNKILDKSNKQIILEIKKSQEKMKELKRAMLKELKEFTKDIRELKFCNSTLRSELSIFLKGPVPWNIRVQINEELEKWKEDDKKYIETNGARSVFKSIKENGCVVVTASSGSGKSSLVCHVALQMQVEGYDILPITNPEEIISWYNPSKKILFVVDDFCGTYSLNPTKFESWKNLMKKIKTLVEKKPIKLIMSCRLQVYKDEQMKSLSFFQSNECNLLSADLCLSKTEKQSIAEFYLKKNASKISEIDDMFDCFPLLCHLYSKNTKLKIVDFFMNPYTVYKEEIDELQREGAHGKYCALALCVMFNNSLKEELLTEDVNQDIKTVIKNTYEACRIVEGTSRLVLRDELDSLTDTFIRKDGEMYRTIHDKLFDFLAFYFGNVMFHCLVNNASSSFIRERFLFGKKGDELKIIIPEEHQNMYVHRMIEDWSKVNITDVFSNINMENQVFRQLFHRHVKGLEKSKQKQLASLFDRHDNSTPLLSCCYIGDISLVKWCLDHCTSNVNHCSNSYGVSPLYIACAYRHTEVAKMLINKRADINIGDVSPLYIACQEGHTEVVRTLLHNRADVNKCDEEEVSPLYIACQYGHTEIVKKLLKTQADINKCRYTGGSPLHTACENGHIEIVKMLINNKANINKCNDHDGSPLYSACQEGRIEVVEMLINNKADINQYITTGESPLYIACQEGHADIVQMLIKNNADINKRVDTGDSPLTIAQEVGHTEIVNILMNHILKQASIGIMTKKSHLSRR